MKSGFVKTGEPWVWATAAALGLTLLIASVLVGVVLVNGLGVFWPSEVVQGTLKDGGKVTGEIVRRETAGEGQGQRIQFKTANRDMYGLDFKWVDEADLEGLESPGDVLVLERIENGNFIGFLQSLSVGQSADFASLKAAMAEVARETEAMEGLAEQISDINYRLEEIRLETAQLLYRGKAENSPEVQVLTAEKQQLEGRFSGLVSEQAEQRNRLRDRTAVLVDGNGTEKQIALADIVDAYQPNRMSVAAKSLHYLGRLKELIIGEPRESNTEGGLFPAIFGTVLLIFIMSFFSFPLGVVAAVYLREYAKDGWLVRLVRIAVNNLAGIPSIVYGIFGLGFFVYGIGGSIDRIFYPERLPSPTFGTGGILWASLTLALLTVPVVIVSTEEALGAIPREMREGSYALGSTKFQTLVRILLPMASPGILTGLILAMSRAAGEVAPLMITGVVKLAPALPLDGHFPYLHLDRKFMHLGFHIFDIGFQSPNVEAAKPMVFVTALLLVMIVLAMSSFAIHLRNKMKKRYSFGIF